MGGGEEEEEVEEEVGGGAGVEEVEEVGGGDNFWEDAPSCWCYCGVDEFKNRSLSWHFRF